MIPAIAVVGMACRYPDASSPTELWDNVLARRQAFRRIPPERLRIEDYLSADRSAEDTTYASQVAVIEDWEFDRVRFRVAGSTFRSADLAHWLTLDVAAQALADAGFADGTGLPRETTGVVIGNTLTGEFSRANLMRLRWPFVRRVVEATLSDEGWSLEKRRAFLRGLEARYKAPFPAVDGESLAGGLSNTIAGRVCNHFDLRGGGYVVDAACAGSLLAVITACGALVSGDLDVALAGGVDLSLDPFELVGFARAGALAADTMRVYDAHSAGFWPGEGCGVVVLMRQEDAITQGRRIDAVIRGWGISSDGSGGITRPELEGQLLALRRAYRRADCGIDTVGYFEGHGTGTSVGDATELRALSTARREAACGAPPAAIGSIKANIGHTKAAAGVAALIKTTMALKAQILPPATGCDTPHPELTQNDAPLRLLSEGESWPAARPLRAGISAMGFGGINTHVVVDGLAPTRRRTLGVHERALLGSAQDAELFLLSAADVSALRRQVDRLLTLAPGLSQAELGDLAATLAISLVPDRVRAAVAAATPTELTDRLAMLEDTLRAEVPAPRNERMGIFWGAPSAPPRVGFLFPGQGAPAHLDGGAWRRRFDFVRELYERQRLPLGTGGIATDIAQPAIVTATIAGLRVLDALGVSAAIAIGHSLGELTALHWGGALDEPSVLRIAAARGRAMADLGSSTGAMASIGAGASAIFDLGDGLEVTVAGLNSPRQTVVAGEAAAVATMVDRARARGLHATPLPVSHAFHSPLIAAAVPAVAEQLAGERFQPLGRTVVSTVTGGRLMPDEDLRDLLIRQITAPVRFMDAVAGAGPMDLWIEVGPGQTLSGLITSNSTVPALPLDAGGCSLTGLLYAAGAAFTLGAPVNPAGLFAGRFTRPFDLDRRPRFLVNPCERAPLPEREEPHQPVASLPAEPTAPEPPGPPPVPASDLVGVEELPAPSSAGTTELVRELVAMRAELPIGTVNDDDRLLSDLHLNSITVGELVSEAARRLGLAPPVDLTAFADATVGSVADALGDLTRTGGADRLEEHRIPTGIESWVRPFTVDLVDAGLPRRRPRRPAGTWRIIAPPDNSLAEQLRPVFSVEEGNGVVVCLPPEPDERDIPLLLEGAQAIVGERDAQFVLVQHGGGAASFVRTLFLEAPDVTTSVVDVPVGHPLAVEWVLAEARAAVGYGEAHYDEVGRRREPVLRLLSLPKSSHASPVGPDDVLVVTGGGKGIAAECALALARVSGARLGLIGRSRPDQDADLAANLARLRTAGVDVHYVAADVGDAVAVTAAIQEIETRLGRITGVIHGAGTNVPQLLTSLDAAAFQRTLGPKVMGARNVLAAIDPDRLRLLITFGSVIARTGMRGEADYALANEWSRRLTEEYQMEHPACRCLTLEWSIWSGVGMGERLGRVEALRREGITPIPADIGVATLQHLLDEHVPTTSIVVAGRLGNTPTVRLEQGELPFHRFLEQPRVYYPGVELVADADISVDSDPYLNDHVFRGERLLPAVLGLEAMAQAASALADKNMLPVFEHVEFARPIVVPDASSITIRVAALVREPGQIDVVLRSSQTAFRTDHFRATCHFPDKRPIPTAPATTFPIADRVPLDPAQDLYGNLLFHTGRFQRVGGYRWLRATECIAEIAPGEEVPWFGPYLPAALLLGDPGSRDAALHAIQACIPHAAILPTGIDRLVVFSSEVAGPRFAHARERARSNAGFVYDLDITDAHGSLVERWEGLALQAVEERTPPTEWTEALLGPYMERRLGEFAPAADARITVERNGAQDRRARSDRAMRRALASLQPIQRRIDGRPEVMPGTSRTRVAVSAAHAGTTVLAVAGSSPLACDLEVITDRPRAMWGDLLGAEGMALAEFVAGEGGEDLAEAATRIWSARECLKKAGAIVDTPLVFAESGRYGWAVFSAGLLTIPTLVTSLRGKDSKLVLSILVERRPTVAGCNG